MKARNRVLGAALSTSAILFLAKSAAAQCPADGAISTTSEDLVLSMSGRMSGTQKILVIPVVDETYAYNPATRQFAGSEFSEQLERIQGEYATNGAYWAEASYGNVILEGFIPTCFYQVSGTFPTADEDAFQRALLKSAEASNLNGIAYTSFTLKYVSDPAEGEKSVDFVSDGVAEMDREAFLVDLQSQASLDAPDLEIELIEVTGTSFQLLFQIKEDRTFTGSRIRIDKTLSDLTSRLAVGLVEPTFSQPMDGEVAITSDGATLPGTSLITVGDNVLFTFQGPSSAFDNAYWEWVGPSCGVSTPCPTWTNAASLSTLFVPQSGYAGSITDTTVAGRPELVYHFQVNTGMTFTSYTMNEGTDAPDNPIVGGMLRRLGIARVEQQDGTADAIGVPFGSHLVTADGLESFLTQEFTGPDAGCLGMGGELPNSPANFKQAADAFLDDFSAIHVYLLSAADSQRDNAGRAVLCSDVSVNGTNQTYKVSSPVALVEISSLADTIVHETGHNIGFPDLYDNSHTLLADVPSDYHPDLTFPGEWDAMAASTKLSHVSSFTKQFVHAWINEPGITDNGTIATVTPIDGEKTFILTPLERPRAGYDNMMGAQEFPVVKMIIVPIGNATSTNPHVPAHFLAVENRQEGLDFSQELPWHQDGVPGFLRGGVRVSDNISDLGLNGTFIKPIARNYSHSLVPGPSFPPAGGQTIAAGTSLDTTATFPSYPGVTIQNVEVVPGPGADQPPSFKVRIVNAPMGTVDLQVKPWLAPDQYATNAIWFEPASTVDPPASPVVPDQSSTDPAAVGNVNPPLWLADYTGDVPLNWIHVRVENVGTYNVENVRVKATFNSPGGAGDGTAWEPIVPDAFSQPKAITAGGAAVFSIPWNPDEELAADGHTCVAVEVVDWTVQGGLGHVADINPFNNVAQENIHSMMMKAASPWQDVPFRFEVHNSYDHEVPVEVEAINLQRGYRVSMPQATAVLSAHTSRVFEGTFGWDSTLIPTPPNQNPNDPFWQACEGPPVSQVTLYDAEDMVHSGGFPVEGPGWVLDENGYMLTTHQFLAGLTTITVFAAGVPSNGVWPHMTVSVGGLPVGDLSVSSGDVSEYGFTFEATAGPKELRVAFDNDFDTETEDRALYVMDVAVETEAAPPHCGGIWGLSAWARLGDYRVPLGGSSFVAEARPVGTITTNTSVNSGTGDVTVTGTVNPPYGGQDVRIYVRYPSGRVDIIDVVTDSGGGYTTTFPPRERGPVTISTELPRGGGPYAPTDPTETTVDACIPTSVVPPTCSDGTQNQGETGIDCGGPCAPCCTAATAVELGAPGTNKTVPIGGCVRVQTGYPWW
jgi:hypothetical protein